MLGNGHVRLWGAGRGNAPAPGLSGGVGATVDTLVEAERQFRKFDGFSDLAKLAVTLERELTSPQPNRVHDREAAIVATASYQTRTATANFHAGRDIF
jgi:hypothetical protein